MFIWDVLLSDVDWDYFKTLTLLEILKIRIDFWRNIVRFLKSCICSTKLDVQETNFSFLTVTLQISKEIRHDDKH